MMDPAVLDYRSSVPPVDDEALQEHLERVQKALIASVDRQLVAMEERLQDRDFEVQRGEERKKDMGAMLYNAQVELRRLNDSMADARRRTDAAEIARKLSHSEQMRLERLLSDARTENSGLRLENNGLRDELHRASGTAEQLKELNAAYNSDIKVRRGLEGRLESDLALVREDHEDTKRKLEGAEKTIRRLEQEVESTNKALARKTTEANVSRVAVEKLERELDQTAGAAKGLVRQWEDGLNAMSRRDETLQAVVQESARLQDAADLSKRVARTSEAEAERLRSERDRAIAEAEAMRGALDRARIEVGVLEQRNSELLRRSQLAEGVAHMFQADIEGVRTQITQLEDESMRRGVAAVHMKTQREEAVRRLDEALERNDSTRQRAEHELRELDHSLEKMSVEQEGRVQELRNLNCVLRAKMKETERNAEQVKKERDSLNVQVRHIGGHYEQLYRDSRYLMDTLERKQHAISTLTSQLGAVNYDSKTKPLEITVRRMGKELEDMRAEYEQLKGRWVENQGETVKLGRTNAKLTDSESELKTRLLITETIGEKTKQEADGLRKEVLEQHEDKSRVLAELRRIQPMVQDLEYRNRVLEDRCEELRRKLAAAETDSRASAHALRAEVRQLQLERDELRRTQSAELKSQMVMERKLTITREILHKKREDERDSSKRSNELSVKLSKAERKYAEVAQSLQTWSDHAVVQIESSAAAKRARNAVRDSSAEEDDAQLLRLKLNRATSELAQARNEMTALRAQMDELASRSVEIGRHLSEERRMRTHIEEDFARCKADLKSLSARCVRAEALAASIETQFKECKPNKLCVCPGHRTIANVTLCARDSNNSGTSRRNQKQPLLARGEPTELNHGQQETTRRHCGIGLGKRMAHTTS
eukprot:Opistho-2@33096